MQCDFIELDFVVNEFAKLHTCVVHSQVMFKVSFATFIEENNENKNYNRKAAQNEIVEL